MKTSLVYQQTLFTSRIASLTYFIHFSKAQFEFLEWKSETEQTGDCSKAHENGTKMDWSKSCTLQGR